MVHTMMTLKPMVGLLLLVGIALGLSQRGTKAAEADALALTGATRKASMPRMAARTLAGTALILPLAATDTVGTFYTVLRRQAPLDRAVYQFTTGTCGAAWSARRPVKPEAAGSNPVRSAVG